jgi:hypothetical protein
MSNDAPPPDHSQRPRRKRPLSPWVWVCAFLFALPGAVIAVPVAAIYYFAPMRAKQPPVDTFDVDRLFVPLCWLVVFVAVPAIAGACLGWALSLPDHDENEEP